MINEKAATREDRRLCRALAGGVTFEVAPLQSFYPHLSPAKVQRKSENHGREIPISQLGNPYFPVGKSLFLIGKSLRKTRTHHCGRVKSCMKKIQSTNLKN